MRFIIYCLIPPISLVVCMGAGWAIDSMGNGPLIAGVSLYLLSPGSWSAALLPIFYISNVALSENSRITRCRFVVIEIALCFSLWSACYKIAVPGWR
ncbi:hypothetical protein Mal52_00350 [Symmachiella dynata]|uniref:Uncharacterized protein n=1 Tax=Symmachiella dynata TaxID=2527995 RepID=A0A517ZGL0_9PLAN|nr:hypothetical protein Mal52_00350 [Symmachiella dynata]